MSLNICVLNRSGEETIAEVDCGGWTDSVGFFVAGLTHYLNSASIPLLLRELGDHSGVRKEGWEEQELPDLLKELEHAQKVLGSKPPYVPGPNDEPPPYELTGAKTLADCFQTVMGDPLINELRGLVQKAITTKTRITFQ